MFLFVRDEVGLVRDGLVEQAVASARRQVELGLARRDDQMVLAAFAGAAWTLARTGHEAEAGALLDEFLERRRENPAGVTPGYWMV